MTRQSSGYQPDTSKQLYFDLELEVKDNAVPEPHVTNGTVKIVVMTGVNNVTFGFDNTLSEIDDNKETIIRILNDTFQWSFSQKGSTEGSGTRAEGEPFTTLEGYFVNPSDNFKEHFKAHHLVQLTIKVVQA